MMRFLCLTFGILSCVAVAARAAPAPEPETPQADIRLLLKDIDDIRRAGDALDCVSLEPVPLYEGGPSLRDWTAFCRARVSGDREACAELPARIVPDLRSLCDMGDASAS